MSRQVKDGRSARWEAHREERRAELVLAAVAAIDALGPSAGISEIAREAGVSKPVLYRYFDGLDDLYAAVGRWGAEEVLQRLLPAILTEAPIRERVARGVDAYLATIAEHPHVFLLLVRHRAAGNDPLADGKAAIAATFARVLGDTMRELGIDAGGAEPWAQSLVGMGLATGEWWLERQTMSRSAVGGYLTSFIWHAFSGTAGELGVPLQSLDAPDAVPGSITPLEERR
ncbi:TetR/AcrR family transcriptional regulator [Nocardioides sp. YIM 152315]|uniref:TetR/AcrR family transcriptional regulator n=1 Tax=Nocardioides sp. YIM 152315 TaxID=3031760 RepID=UPI0023DA51EF|nr:TetR/AcrR family transcriptional regulator [Nocardioides sp. YIM 152315]MDF1606453.1 TetR/AcrR family transcriptional regulator [Nocardioides sp. YIM 152315]